MEANGEFGPWNPGILSTLPAALLPFVTHLDPANVFETIEEVDELCAFTGLPREQLVTFRPMRLLVHELLVRVCADYAVSDGDQYEDLGNNFRRMTSTILQRYLCDCETDILQLYTDTRAELETVVEQCLADTPVDTAEKARSEEGWLSRIFKPRAKVRKTPSPLEKDQGLIAHWQRRSTESEGLDKVAYRHMAKTIGSILTLHGRIRGERDLQLKLVVNQMCNEVASQRIGVFIAPLVAEGAKAEGFESLPAQSAPVIINVKGASAAGKSTLRPLQQELTARLGLDWREFALISPDIFRKFLLEYESLGEHYKYAGMCSGEELQIVDEKLDALMARKARDNQLSHLLIDRFRFDSFATKSNEEGSNLLTRFGSRVFMFFMITPPHSTVERAYNRGLQVGRFKAVDDLLDHNVEAFNGMPQLFFTWALNREKDVYYEFLDNSVALGEKPRTVAYGDNGNLTILDLEKFVDIKRYQQLDVNAEVAEAVYSKSTADPDVLLELVKECLLRLDEVTFCDFASGQVYARMTQPDNRITLDKDALHAAIGDEQLAVATEKLFNGLTPEKPEALQVPVAIDRSAAITLGNSGGGEDV